MKILLIVLVNICCYFYLTAQSIEMHMSNAAFVSSGNRIAALVAVPVSMKGSLEYKNYVVFLTKADGKLIRQIRLNETGLTLMMNLSRDGSRIIIVKSNDKEESIISSYNTISGRSEWSKTVNGCGYCLGLFTTSNDARVVYVSANGVFHFDAFTGKELWKSSNIRALGVNINNSRSSYFYINSISADQKYLALYKNTFFLSTLKDELGCCFAPQNIWYGVRWLFSLGRPVNEMYLWNLEKDSLYGTIPVPAGILKSPPVMKNDLLFVGPLDHTMNIYSTGDWKKLNTVQINPEYLRNNFNDDLNQHIFYNMLVSEGNDFLAIEGQNEEGRLVAIVNLSNGIVKDKINNAVLPEDRMLNGQSGFSGSSLLLIKDEYPSDKIILYDVITGKIIWECIPWISEP